MLTRVTHVKDKNRSKIKTCPPRFALIIRIGTEKVWNLAGENISIENIRPVERVTSMLVTDVGDKIWDETKSCWWRFLPFWSPSVGAGRTATYLVKTISEDADLHKRPLKNFYFFFHSRALWGEFKHQNSMWKIIIEPTHLIRIHFGWQ